MDVFAARALASIVFPAIETFLRGRWPAEAARE